MKQLKLGVVLTIGADIPLLKNTHLDQVINEYWICQKPALAVMNRPAKHEAQGLSATMMLDSPENKEKLVPVGINILDGHLTDLPEQEQAIYVLEDETLLFNINTVTDYKILTSKYGSGKV
ncbi:MAG: hypothetical protein A2Y88_10925 [Chloroflexi bacterium RBG_13_48_10]|nr:MAG: hypothetical protein A2Y88_10925 [Chloroflexi bacterium RBG_13_48_10]